MNGPLGQLVVLAVRGARCRFATEDLVDGGASEEEPSPPQQRDDGQRTMQSKWGSLVRSPAATGWHADAACARRRKPPGGYLSDPPAPCEFLEVAKTDGLQLFLPHVEVDPLLAPRAHILRYWTD